MSILITGGTGSFGNACVQKLLDRGHTRICIYSRGEHAQAEMRERFGDDQRLRWFIGDVRDRDRLRWAMMGVDNVIHAAALKRIEVGKYNPIEMVKTNVHGAINIIEAATDAKVKSVVGLSSDKAYQPISAYGQTKALSESLFLVANDTHWPRFAVTRYGNVAGSRGSVIPLWRRTENPRITDPECTRFWMTMDEAVNLVLGAAGTDELVIPKLPAFRLGDLAEAMNLTPEVVGLGDHEKKHEGMEDGNTSDTARRMSVDELREALKNV